MKRTSAIIAEILFGWVCIALACVVAIVLVGCGPKKLPVTEEAATIAGGSAKAQVGLDGARNLLGKLADLELPNPAPGLVRGTQAHVATAQQGVTELRKAGESAARQADRSRQGFYHSLDWASLIGGVVLAIGIALVVTGKAAGIGIAAFGGALAIGMMLMRASTPALPWLMLGLVVIALGGVGYLVYWRITVYRRMKEEQLATKELVKTVDKLAPHIPEPERTPLFEQEIRNIQSPSTEALVKQAKQQMGSGEVTVTTSTGKQVVTNEATVTAGAP